MKGINTERHLTADDAEHKRRFFSHALANIEHVISTSVEFVPEIPVVRPETIDTRSTKHIVHQSVEFIPEAPIYQPETSHVKTPEIDLNYRPEQSTEFLDIDEIQQRIARITEGMQ